MDKKAIIFWTSNFSKNHKIIANHLAPAHRLSSDWSIFGLVLHALGSFEVRCHRPLKAPYRGSLQAFKYTAIIGWIVVLSDQGPDSFFFYKPNPRTYFCLHVFRLKLPQMAWLGFFPQTFMPRPRIELTSFQCCTSSRDLNSECFTHWATTATATLPRLTSVSRPSLWTLCRSRGSSSGSRCWPSRWYWSGWRFPAHPSPRTRCWSHRCGCQGPVACSANISTCPGRNHSSIKFLR